MLHCGSRRRRPEGAADFVLCHTNTEILYILRPYLVAAVFDFSGTPGQDGCSSQNQTCTQQDIAETI